MVYADTDAEVETRRKAFLTEIWRHSKSVQRVARQCLAARVIAPNMGLRTCRSPQGFGGRAGPWPLWGRVSPHSLEAAAFLDEEALKDIQGSDRPAVGDGHAQMGNAGLEVGLEAGDGGGQVLAVVCADTLGQMRSIARLDV